MAVGLAVLVGLVPVVFYMLHQAESTAQIILAIGSPTAHREAETAKAHRG